MINNGVLKHKVIKNDEVIARVSQIITTEKPILAYDDEQCSSLGNSSTSWGADC